MWTSPGIWPKASRWSNLAFTFDWLQRYRNYYFSFHVSIKTKALSLVYLNPDHQNLIDRIMGLHEKGWIPKKISEHLNELGVNSWSGKQFYPELVFGIVRKARLRAARDRESTSQESLVVELRCSSAL
jgi:hypothetical protein